MSGVFMPWADKYKVDSEWVGPLPPGIKDGERRFEIETSGHGWNLIRKVRGLAIVKGDDGITVYGDRSLVNPVEDGYVMRGSVSIDGKKHRAFTSSQLFRGPGGKLFDVAVLYVTKR